MNADPPRPMERVADRAGRRGLRGAAVTAVVSLVAGLSAAVVPGMPAAADHAGPFVVDATGDEGDADAGDGACETSEAVCTLRAAIEEANAGSDAHEIAFSGDTDGTPIALASPLPTVTESLTVTGNGRENTVVDGSGDRVFDATAPLTVSELTLQNGASDSGGAIHSTGDLTVTNARFEANTAAGTDGGSPGEDGDPAAGGAIHHQGGTLTVSGSEFEGNTATGGDGDEGTAGANADDPTESLNGEIGDPGGAGGAAQGGAIFSSGAVTITDSTFLQNTATGGNGAGGGNGGDGLLTGTGGKGGNGGNGGAAEGGAVFSSGAFVVTGSTFAENSVIGGGGGAKGTGGADGAGGDTGEDGDDGAPGEAGAAALEIENSDMTASTVENSTFSGNGDSGAGSVVSNAGSGSLTLIYVTVFDNDAADGTSAVANGVDGSLTLRTTIVAGTSGDNCAGTVTSGGHNLDDDGTCVGASSEDGDQQVADIGLEELADNGGPTQTHLPLPDSPAVDVIPNADCTVGIDEDQRGFSRPVPDDGACDVGALERNLRVVEVNTPVDGGHGDDVAGGLVNCANPDALCTLRSAIEVVTSGATIGFANGVNPQLEADRDALVVSGDITIVGNLNGSGPGTTVSGGASFDDSIFIVVPDATVTIENLVVTGGSADPGGGGIVNHGTLLVMNSSVQGNAASSETLAGGGGLANFGGSVTLENSIVSGNAAHGGEGGGEGANGGGIYTDGGSLSLRDSTVAGNRATGALNFGGGVYNIEGSVTLENSTVSGNTASATDGGVGGGIVTFIGQMTIENSTVSGNEADDLGGGVAVGGGSADLVHATISGNTSADGAGIVVDSATVTLTHTILDNEGPECLGGVDSDGHNIASDGSCDLDGPGDRNSTNPKLKALADNGGATLTHLPSPGSPALGGGKAAPCLLPTDQRGVSRPQPGATKCDIGAVESSAAPASGGEGGSGGGTTPAPPSASEPAPTEVRGSTVSHTPVRGQGTTTDGGYWVLDDAGGVFAFGDARFFGSVPGLRAAGQNIGDARAVALASTGTDGGYWVLDEAGGVFGFGDARFFGSVPGLRQAGQQIGSARAVDIVATPSGGGYWVLDEAGGVFGFGDARFFGSVPGLRAAGQSIPEVAVVAIEPTPSGNGYWVLDDAGGVFAFGDARFFGSVPGLRAAGQQIGPARAVDLAATPSGKGYWVLDDAGGVFTFGDARFLGSVPDVRAAGVPVGPMNAVTMEGTGSGRGYWIFDDAGGVFTFGDARFFGSVPALRQG